MRSQIVLAALVAAFCVSAETVRTATQPWVRSYVAMNMVDISGKADKTNTYTKAETDAKIVELSPTTSLEPATNYTDAVAAEFEDGTREVDSAKYSGSASDAMFAYYLSGDEWSDQYNASDLIREFTNAAIAVAARKQDALPYPTNAIPYAAIDGAPGGGTPEWRVVEIDENTTVSFVTNGIAAKLINGELYATTNGWPDGASMFVRGTVVYWPYDVGEEIRLIGYGTWPTNNFQSVWWRSGPQIFVNILLEE